VLFEYLFLSFSPDFSLADVSSWEPVMPRSISGSVMQLMRVANVGGGGLRAEVVTYEMEKKSELQIVQKHAVFFQGYVELAGVDANELTCSHM